MIEYWDYQDGDVVRWELAGLFSKRYGRNMNSIRFVRYMDGAAARKLKRNESDDFLPVGLFYHKGKVCWEVYLSNRGIELWGDEDTLIPMDLEFLPSENECKAYFNEIGVLDQLIKINHTKVTGRMPMSENTIRITEAKLRKALRKVILEFGEKDHELRQKIQNREKMIGIGMDGGTIPFNPSWDYDKKPASSRAPRGYMGDIIKQVPYVIENNDMHEWLEAKPTRDPEVIHLESGGLLVKVENDYGTLKFNIIKPRDWNWSMECETIDNEIDNVLFELGEYVNEKENPEDF